MKKTVYITLAVFILLQAIQLKASDKLIAYPVPFDPVNSTLKLKYESGASGDSVYIDIFDVNGDCILRRNYSDILSFRWKGFNDDGNMVSNGLYIIKVRREDATTGQVKTDTVRITVVRRKK
jgi:hypothetical protein